MTDVWGTRAALYVESDAHREGSDLDQIVAWAAGSETALDVATGGGHVARRLREEGIEVVTADPSPGMRPDVVCAAEDLPFDAHSFDTVTCRMAAHHFTDLDEALLEMARVARDRVLVVDTLNMGEQVEEAEKVRDPSHVRNYEVEEWREAFTRAGLSVDDLRVVQRSFELQAWLRRTSCDGEDAERAIELLGSRAAAGRITFDVIALKGTVS
jgi:SAM-dependent methyltransferase